MLSSALFEEIRIEENMRLPPRPTRPSLLMTGRNPLDKRKTSPGRNEVPLSKRQKIAMILEDALRLVEEDD